MPLPFIIAGAALAAGSYGVKKGIDGYKSHAEADEIVKKATERYEGKKHAFEVVDKKTQSELERLGTLELDIGKSFDQFKTLADSLLEQINRDRQDKLTINFPKHEMEKIEEYRFTTLGVLGSVAGAGAAGAAAGFAIYGGVMSLAAASTGTAISSLSGVAAYNATLAAIGGGSLATGGLGMAGGTAILGAAVAAPVLAIAGWAYANHGENALENANKASKEVDEAIKKMTSAIDVLSETEKYAIKIRQSLDSIFINFNQYFDKLKDINQLIESSKKLGLESGFETGKISNEIILNIENGYALAAILTNIITTPIFKLKTVNNGSFVVSNNGEASVTSYVKDDNGVPVMDKDSNGLMIINKNAIDNVISESHSQMTLQPI